MRYKTLFRLALKLMAIGIAIEAPSNLFWGVAALAQGWGMAYALSSFLGGLFHLVAAAYLFFGGKWIVEKVFPGNHLYCPECAYDLTGTQRTRCPECDTPFDTTLMAGRAPVDEAVSAPETGKELNS
jgi:hypothetical protein